MKKDGHDVVAVVIGSDFGIPLGGTYILDQQTPRLLLCDHLPNVKEGKIVPVT